MTKARAAILGKVRGVVAARRSAGAVTARPDVYIRPQRHGVIHPDCPCIDRGLVAMIALP